MRSLYSGHRRLLETGLVAFGGFIGAGTRFGLDAFVGHQLIGTFIANVSGCFLLGLLLFDARTRETLSRRSRLLMGTGFTASFTTYSTFIHDIVVVDPVTGAGYAIASYGFGFAAVIVSRAFVMWRESGAPLPLIGGK